MSARHVARTSFMVRCASGRRWQHPDQFREQGRAEHWAATCNVTCDCHGSHEVVPVAPVNVLHVRGWGT